MGRSRSRSDSRRRSRSRSDSRDRKRGRSRPVAFGAPVWHRAAQWQAGTEAGQAIAVTGVGTGSGAAAAAGVGIRRTSTLRTAPRKTARTHTRPLYPERGQRPGEGRGEQPCPGGQSQERPWKRNHDPCTCARGAQGRSPRKGTRHSGAAVKCLLSRMQSP